MVFFCDESMNHLLSSPFPLRGLRIREGTHSHSHCHSSLGASGQGRWWSLGSGKHQQANLRRVGIKDIHHPQSILQQRMPRSFKQNKNMAQSEELWGVIEISSLQKGELAGTLGVTHPWFADLFPWMQPKVTGRYEHHLWLFAATVLVPDSLTVSSKKSPTQHWTARHTQKIYNESPYHLHESVYSLWLLSCKVLHLRISICAQGPRCPEREIGSVGSSKNLLWESFQNRS